MALRRLLRLVTVVAQDSVRVIGARARRGTPRSRWEPLRAAGNCSGAAVVASDQRFLVSSCPICEVVIVKGDWELRISGADDSLQGFWFWGFCVSMVLPSLRMKSGSRL